MSLCQQDRWIWKCFKKKKSRLIGKGYNQYEWIDFDETYVPVARLEAIGMLLDFNETYVPGTWIYKYFKWMFKVHF